MFFYDNEDNAPMNRFIFISIMIHVVLFLTYPQWSSLLVSDAPGLETGGVIQVMYSAESRTRQVSPVVDPVSKTSIPQVEKPRPTSEPPKEMAATTRVTPEVPEIEMPRPEPNPEPKPEPKSEPRPEPQPEIKQEPVTEPVKTVPEITVPDPTVAVVPKPTPELERPPTPETGQLLTSEHGREVVLDKEPEEIVAVDEREDTKLANAEPVEVVVPPQPVVEESRPSSSGSKVFGAESDSDGGIQESGFGEAEIAPPPPPPPPSGQAAHVGGRNPIYPKNAEHDGVEGIVGLDVTISAAGQIVAVDLIRPSGDSRLDQQAIQTIRANWEFRPMFRDYVLTLDVEFAQTLDNGSVQFGSNVHYKGSRWLE